MNPLEIDHPQRSELGELDRHAHINHAIHGAGDDGNFPLNAAQAPTGIGHVGIHSPPARDQGDFVNSVGPANGARTPQLNVHREPLVNKGRKLTIRLPLLRLSDHLPVKELQLVLIPSIKLRRSSLRTRRRLANSTR